MATVSEDLQIEILLCLPAKSLLRFKSVCKGWCSLISSRRFCLLHTGRHPTTTTDTTASVLLRRYGSKYYHFSPCKANPKPTPVTLPGRVVHSCNGLLLCRCRGSNRTRYYIYNLATGLRRKLDLVATGLTRKLGCLSKDEIECLTLAFDPSNSPHYKVICVKALDSFESTYCYQIGVFDSESSSWTIVIEKYTVRERDCLDRVEWRRGVYWNNAIHWNRINSGCFLYFDIDKGTISHGPEFSSFYRLGGFGHVLVESGGQLNYIISGGYDGGSKLVVFEMERDYSKWFIKYEVEYGGLSKYVSVDGGIVLSQNGQEWFVLLYVNHKLMVYSRIDESFHEVIMQDRLDTRPCHVHQFVETLAPV